jgi:F-type H+-transporting ATPase subunit b
MERLYRAALAEATAAANASREEARREIDAERDNAKAQLEQQARALGQQIVSRLLPTP